jgi:hypothetical protein
MLMPVYEIRETEDIRRLRQDITSAAAKTSESLLAVLRNQDPLAVLAAMRFDLVGNHPLEDRPLNLSEQLHQTSTYLVSLAAAEWLLREHKISAPIQLNLGTASGFDLQCETAGVVAETFAAVHRNNNDKLRRDARRVSASNAEHKYVFFYCPDEAHQEFCLRQFPQVQVIRLRQHEVWGGLARVGGTSSSLSR